MHFDADIWILYYKILIEIQMFDTNFTLQTDVRIIVRHFTYSWQNLAFIRQ